MSEIAQSRLKWSKYFLRGGFVKIVTISLTIFALILAGCGKNESERNNLPDQQPTTDRYSAVEDSTESFDPIANPQAPSGGELTTWGSGFPKSLNMWLDYNSFSKEIMDLLYGCLVTLHSTKNEPVGILAQTWSVSPDGKTFVFTVHKDACWSDGTPITAADFQFYYDVIMNPKNMTSLFRVDLKRFNRPEIIDEKTISITAHTAHWSNFWSAGSIVAFPRHAWKDLDFNKINFDFPIVSGPYRIKELQKNQFLLLERRNDWWGRVKKYNAGKYNFELIKYKFMEDQIKVLEAFKKGDFDLYPVYTSSLWMKQTDFDAVKNGWVVKQKVYNLEPKGFQGFAINLRREKFQDVRVRLALCYLINRESMNEKLMFNQYFLLNSYFPDLYPDNVNSAMPMVHFNPDTARVLLKAAGWEVGADGLLVKNGLPLEIVFMHDNSDLRHLNIYIEDLKKVGIKASIEQLSQSTKTKRMDNFDFDLIWVNWNAVRLRDPEAVWHSSTANQVASNNYTGVKDAIIDSLIEMQKTEMSLDKRNDILRAIDKRLCEIVPYVFLWNADNTRLLYWNRFGTPKFVLDKYFREDCIVTYWWYDSQKAAALQEAMKKNSPLPKEPFEIHYQE
jgi:microcin C transport system substrate-binding protein